MQVLLRPLSHHHYPARARAAAAGLVAGYRAMFPDAIPGIVDTANWTENTSMMLALRDEAERNAIPFHVLDAVELSLAEIGSSAGSSALTPRQNPNDPNTVMWGYFDGTDSDGLPKPANLLWNSREMVTLLSQWAEIGIFETMCGATFEAVAPSTHTVRQAMARSRKHGNHYATLRCTGLGWVHFLDLSQDIPSEVKGLIRNAETMGKLLVLQVLTNPAYEYRVFIVGKDLITGSGCLDDLTPLDHIEENPFDFRMEEQRGAGLPWIELPELTEEYLKFAQEFADKWALRVSEKTSYALDMCWDEETGRIVPMDVSPLANSGLYASSTKRLAEAFCSGL